IIVTFLFVIMLAQQEGQSSADQRTREPFLATVAGFLLLAALLIVLQRNYDSLGFDSLLARIERASHAESTAEMESAIGDAAKLLSQLQLLVPKPKDKVESATSGTASPADTRAERELWDTVEGLSVLLGAPKKLAQAKELADKAHRAGRYIQQRK